MDIFLDLVNINEKDTLYRLLEYSLYEESLTDGNEMNNNGLFEYESFDDYFNNKQNIAYFIKELNTNKLLGFVMLNIKIDKYIIKEFMVIPKYRKKKIGTKAVYMILNKYKGNYEIAPSIGSQEAFMFWNNVIKKYINKYEFKNGIFIFSNKEE